MSDLAHAIDTHAHDDGHGHGHGHGKLVENNFMGLPNLKLAMWAFLGSECMFFGSLIGTYMFYRDKSIGGPLPEDIFSIGITSISTFLLLMSSLTMALAVDSMKQSKTKRAQAFLGATALLGASFVGFQVYEFSHFYHLGLTLKTSLFGSSFYVMTGFHGAHVTIGVLWLSLCNLMIQRGRIKPGHFLPVEVSGLYWHFVDIVWIIIFTFVYLLEFVRA
jgi:heme/copper-type cytochrome/quinol oxidase subunit 3